jgi:hypothetical protein
MVAKKQAATPTNNAAPRCPKPRQMEKISEPKASIVVNDVKSIALPVLANIIPN